MHLHNPYPLLSPWVVRTAHAAGVPVVQTVHNYRQVCAAGIYFRDGHVCTDCRGRRVGVPAIVHACYRGSRAQSAVMATALALHRPTWRSVDRYIALTDAVAEHLVDYGISPDRIVVKPNSVADPGEPDPAGDGFLFFGRLVAEKGLGLVLDAWRRHPEGSLGMLRIAGDGPMRPAVEAAAAERSDVDFLGPQDRAGVRAALRDSSVVITASTWHDVLPTVVIEALASGRPVLGTAHGWDPVPRGFSRLGHRPHGRRARRRAAPGPDGGAGTDGRRARALPHNVPPGRRRGAASGCVPLRHTAGLNAGTTARRRRCWPVGTAR